MKYFGFDSVAILRPDGGAIGICRAPLCYEMVCVQIGDLGLSRLSIGIDFARKLGERPPDEPNILVRERPSATISF